MAARLSDYYSGASRRDSRFSTRIFAPEDPYIPRLYGRYIAMSFFVDRVCRRFPDNFTIAASELRPFAQRLAFFTGHAQLIRYRGPS
jgi:hypothetical protein